MIALRPYTLRWHLPVLQAPPLLVMNNFSAAEHLKLVVELFRNMFPSLNAQTVKLANCQVPPHSSFNPYILLYPTPFTLNVQARQM